MDVVLDAVFRDASALAAYLVHPLHEQAETTTMPRGSGIDCPRSNSSCSQSPLSRVGGKPWLTNTAGRRPSEDSQTR